MLAIQQNKKPQSNDWGLEAIEAIRVTASPNALWNA